jgi:hypothetical protein
MTTEREILEIQLTAPPDAAAQAVERAVESWDADFEGWENGRRGQLYLPVSAGLRHGMVRGEIAVEPRDRGARVVFRPEEARYQLHSTAVGVLVISAVGALLLLLWPFLPQEAALARVAPLGAVLALGGWFLVVSRLTTRDARDFLDLVATLADRPEPGEPAPEAIEPGRRRRAD